MGLLTYFGGMFENFKLQKRFEAEVECVNKAFLVE